MGETITVGGVEVKINQSKRAKRLILRAAPTGVTLAKPRGVSYRAAVDFAKQQKNWIAKNYQPAKQPANGDLIGSKYRIKVASGNNPGYRISGGSIFVRISPMSSQAESSDMIKRACIEALRKESKDLVKTRLPYWQEKMSLTPDKVTIRHSVGRWGSCSSKRNLNFSLFIAQLEPELLDYIFVHELAHIKHQNHQGEFWRLVEDHQPRYKSLRKKLRNRRLALEPR